MLLDRGRVAASGPATEALVPEHLAPVYEVGVRRLQVDDGFQLIFRPPGPSRACAAPPVLTVSQ